MLRASSDWKRVEPISLEDIVTIPLLDFRMTIDQDEEFAGLIRSIQRHGLLQPLIVRPARGRESHREGRKFELLCGHRRLAASKRLGCESLPCIVMDLDDREAFEIALVENVQKQSLNPIEEAEAFKSYVTNFGRGSVTRLAESIGKSEEYVSHRLLLLGLPKELSERISRRLLNPSHATELVWLKDAEKQVELSRAVITHNLSLRQLRYVVRTMRREGITVSEAVAMVLRTPNVESKNHEYVAAGDSVVLAEPWLSSAQLEEEDELDGDLRVLERATLVIRTSLSGIDLLIQKPNNPPELKSLLMRERQSIHKVLDELIKVEVVYKRKGVIVAPAS